MTTITIPGPPMPKPRGQRSDKWRDPPRPCIVKYREFKDRVKLAMSGSLGPILATGRIEQIKIFIPFSASCSERMRTILRGQPHQGGNLDIDNYLKGILDTLFDNDGFIWSIGLIEKRWDDGNGPRIIITLPNQKTEEIEG